MAQMPHLAHFPFTWIVQQPDWRALLEADLDAEQTWDRVKDLAYGLPDTLAAVRDEAVAILAAVVRKDMAQAGDDDEDATDLDLVSRASSVFSCSLCPDAPVPLTWPRVLNHRCSRTTKRPSSLNRPPVKPMALMTLYRPGLRQQIETALEAASLDRHLQAPFVDNFKFFLSPAVQIDGLDVPPTFQLFTRAHKLIDLVASSDRIRVPQ